MQGQLRAKSQWTNETQVYKLRTTMHKLEEERSATEKPKAPQLGHPKAHSATHVHKLKTQRLACYSKSAA